MVLKVGIDYSGDGYLDRIKLRETNSGYILKPQNDADIPVFVAAAVLATTETFREIQEVYTHLLIDEIFAAHHLKQIAFDLPLSKRKITAAKVLSATRHELHAMEMFKKKGEKDWARTTPEQRIKILQELINHLKKSDIKYIYSYINLKSESIQKDIKRFKELVQYKTHVLYTIRAQVKISLLERVLREIFKSSYSDIIILSDRTEEDLDIIREQRRNSRYFSHIYMDVYFSGKNMHVGTACSSTDFSLQIADFFAYSTRRKIAKELGYTKNIYGWKFKRLERDVDELLSSKVVTGPKNLPDGYGKIEVKKIWRSL